MQVFVFPYHPIWTFKELPCKGEVPQEHHNGEDCAEKVDQGKNKISHFGRSSVTFCSENVPFWEPPTSKTQNVRCTAARLGVKLVWGYTSTREGLAILEITG